MGAIKVYDAVATVGTYMRDGVEKKRYQNVGAVFRNDSGNFSLKLEALPLSQDWSGWISFFEPKQRQYNNQNQNNAPATGNPSTQAEADALSRQGGGGPPGMGQTGPSSTPPGMGGASSFQGDNFDDDVPF